MFSWNVKKIETPIICKKWGRLMGDYKVNIFSNATLGL